jgi:hypothetical protein
MKTNELTGAALDWAVAQCEGLASYIEIVEGFKPSTDWTQGGAIIECEGITLRCGLHSWDAELPEFHVLMDGTTPLIAAMRCYVASKLGDEVQIPDKVTA